MFYDKMENLTTLWNVENREFLSNLPLRKMCSPCKWKNAINHCVVSAKNYIYRFSSITRSRFEGIRNGHCRFWTLKHVIFVFIPINSTLGIKVFCKQVWIFLVSSPYGWRVLTNLEFYYKNYSYFLLNIWLLLYIGRRAYYIINKRSELY